ncbi:MAG: glycosyltransferase [Actinomycetota bacterium]
MRLLIVQFAGDYRETVQRFAKGGGETYYAQKYSVDAVAEIGKNIEEVAVICCLTTESYDEILPNGVRAIGAGFHQKIDLKKLIELIQNQKPTHLVLRTPIRELFQWAIRNQVKTLATLADSFSTEGLRNKIRNHRLVAALNHPQIEWVGNHGINSCRSLQKIGVNPHKIIPWDWPAMIAPDSFSPKMLSSAENPRNLFYVGSVSASKGVGDVLAAVAQLKAQNFSVHLKIAGAGETDFFIHQTKQLQIEDCVTFLGLVENQAVVHLMREADLVLIPSRHEYPEGFPMTIYEALCSRTPIVASDHPMFQNYLKNGINAMIFPASNSTALSEKIEKLLSDPTLYHHLSVAAAEAWKQLQIPVKWADLLNRWLNSSEENRNWLLAHTLAARIY